MVDSLDLSDEPLIQDFQMQGHILNIGGDALILVHVGFGIKSIVYVGLLLILIIMWVCVIY